MSITPWNQTSTAKAAAARAGASASDASVSNSSFTSAWPTTPEYTPLGDDSPVASRFLVEADNVEIGVFKTFSGLSAQVSTESVNEGGNNQYPVILPGRISWGNVTLTRGITSTEVMYNWFSQTAGDGYTTNGSLTRQSVAVTAISLEGTRLRTWTFNEAFPVRWKGPDFNIDSDDPLMEELELAHHGVTITDPS